MKFIITVAISFLCLPVYAQFGFGGGLGYGFASLTNRQGYNNNQGVIGGLQLFYEFRNSPVFPSLNFRSGLVQLPVKANNYNDLNVTATNRNLSLNINFKTNDGSQYFIFYAGAGLANVIPDGTSVQENGQAVSLSLNDPGTHMYTVANFGMMCHVRLSQDVPIYLGIEAYLQYLHLYYGNSTQYYLDFNGTPIKASITGDYLYPVLLVSINYVFEKQQKTE